jgi:hypothetical protein
MNDFAKGKKILCFLCEKTAKKAENCGACRRAGAPFIPYVDIFNQN